MIPPMSMAVTMVDLWSREGWSFVFGMAHRCARAGAPSFARHAPAFYENPRGADCALA